MQDAGGHRLDALDCGVLVCDGSGTVVFANRRAEHLLCSAPGALLGRDVADHALWPPVMVDADERPLSSERLPLLAALASAVPAVPQLVGFAPAPGAAPAWVAMSARPVPADGAARPVEIVCTLAEVPVGPRSVRQLWALSSRLKVLLESMPDTCLVVDERGMVLDSFGAAVGVLRCNGAAAGKRLTEVLPGEVADDALASLAEVYGGDGHACFEFAWEADDGERFFEAQYRLLLSGQVAVLLRDVTERFRAEEELVELSALYCLLAEHGRDVIYRMVLQPTPAYGFVSPSVEDILGYSPDELYADPSLVYRIPRRDHVPRLKAVVDGTWDFERPLELCMRHRDGGEVWIEQLLTPEWDEDGTLVAIVGVMRSVTERRLEALRLERQVAKETKAT